MGSPTVMARNRRVRLVERLGPRGGAGGTVPRWVLRGVLPGWGGNSGDCQELGGGGGSGVPAQRSSLNGVEAGEQGMLYSCP